MPEHDGTRKDAIDEKGDPRKSEPEMVELSVAGPDRVPPYFWYAVMFLIACVTIHNIVKLVLTHGE